jgi:subtilase family serine protease
VRRKLLAAAAALATLSGVLLPLSASASAAATFGPSVRLTDDTVRILGHYRLLGAVPSLSRVTVGLALADPNPGGVQSYIEALYDPASPLYRHYLSPAAFQARFGVPSSRFQLAEQWLRADGLTVFAPARQTEYVEATGTAAQVERRFATGLARYRGGNGAVFYANTAEPLVPSELHVQTVLGLNSWDRPHAFISGISTQPPSVETAIPNTGTLTPQNLWSIYDMPNSDLGNGQQMGVIGWGGTGSTGGDPGVIADLRSFEGEFQLPQVPININYYGPTSEPIVYDGGIVEWELDTQASTGMAPDVQNENLYFGRQGTDADLLSALTAWVDDPTGPTQASASWGECENTPVLGGDNLETPGNQVLAQSVAEGKTLFVSTGDTGSSCPIIPEDTNGLATQLYPALNYPSVSPWAVAVGGTDLTSNGANPPARAAEYGWEFGGGGNSLFEFSPFYQRGVPRVKCVSQPDGTPYPTFRSCRSTPDVAAISGDVFTGNGLEITEGGAPNSQGAGTSLSAPVWDGVWTRIQAAVAPRVVNGVTTYPGAGFANIWFYRLGESSHYHGVFYDVTVGDNQPYAAHPGYDNVTGWGTPTVTNLLWNIAGRLTPTNDLPPPVAAVAPTITSCDTLFTGPPNVAAYTVEGQTLSGPGTVPQLDIVGGKMLLGNGGTTLRTILTIQDLNTTIPTGGGENDYNFVFVFNGTTYFTQLAVEPGGQIEAWDGQLVHVALENKYLQIHDDPWVFTPGVNGTVEVDAPLADFGTPAPGSLLQQPAATSYVREGVNQGPLEPADAAGPNAYFQVAPCG